MWRCRYCGHTTGRATCRGCGYRPSVPTLDRRRETHNRGERRRAAAKK